MKTNSIREILGVMCAIALGAGCEAPTDVHPETDAGPQVDAIATEEQPDEEIVDNFQHIDVPDGMQLDLRTGELNSNAMEDDARTVSEDFGIDYEVVLRQMRNERPFDEVVEEMRERYPESFSQGWWSDEGHPLLAFVGSVPADLDLNALDFEMDIELVGDRRTTETELRETFFAADELLHERGYAVDSWVDVLSETMHFRISTTESPALGEGGNIAQQPYLVERQVAALLSTRLEAGTFDVTSGPGLDGTADAYGGDELSDYGRTPRCTTGFSVIAGSTRGVSTAGHCSNYRPTYYYRGNRSNSRSSAYYIREHVGSWGDAQWHRTNAQEYDDFYSDGGTSRRDVSYVEPPYSIHYGEWKCAFGRRSGLKRCGRITRVWDTFKMTDGRRAQRLACFQATPNTALRGGDSGGPVFNGGTAIGSYTGRITNAPATTYCFSRAGFFPNAINAQVLR